MSGRATPDPIDFEYRPPETEAERDHLAAFEAHAFGASLERCKF